MITETSGFGDDWMVFDITSSREPCLALRPVTRGRRDPWYHGDAGRPNPRLPVDSQRHEAGGGVVGTSGFAIPFVVADGEKRVLSENAYYNGEVAKADANGDGKISDAEARAYAQ